MESGKVAKTQLIKWLDETYPGNWEWTGPDFNNQIFWTKDTEDMIGQYVWTPETGGLWELDGLVPNGVKFEIVEEL